MAHVLRDKPCDGCGHIMRQVDQLKQFCPACLQERRREQWRRINRERYRRASEPDAGPPLPPGRLSVDDVARLAQREGISYGQYSVKHRLYERKR